jgi:ABC-type multidrug transport system fused ATPase/permease subunit
VLHHRLTVGELLVVLAYIAAVYKPLETISSTMGSLQQQLVMVQGAFMLLDTEPEIRDAADAIEAGDVRGDVVFDGVSFTYAARDHTLEDISFGVRPGQCIALVGPTGAGKTTLISLLMRFYDPTAGRVLLDGIDVRRFSVSSLRDRISLVLQVPELFSGTIADNIRYGRLDATPDEIVAAARAANADDFVAALPDGYDTKLGEGGAQLSVGERQRICVARAFLKDAPILVLDEPTSAIDSRTEGLILDALDELMVGRTTFVIAHRLSTIALADEIAVLDHGRVVAYGNHQELLDASELYREIVEKGLPESVFMTKETREREVSSL